MITDAIISAFLGCIDALMTVLPNFNIPGDPTSGGLWVGQWAALLNRIVPLQTLVTGILLCVTVKLGMLAFDGALWLYHQIHGAS